MNGERPGAAHSELHWDSMTLYLITIGVIALCFWIVRPFLAGMTWAVVLAIVTEPVYRWILTRLRRPALASAVTLIVVSLSIVVPSLMVMLSAGNHLLILMHRVQSGQEAQSLRLFVAGHPRLNDAVKYVMDNVDMDTAAEKAASAVAGQVGSLLSKSIDAMTQLVVMLFLLFFLYRDKYLYNMEGELTAGLDRVDLDHAAIRRPGGDLTLITYGWSLYKCLAAAETLSREGIEAEVLDLRTLRPLDDAAILASVRRTHRALIVDEGWRSGSLSAEVSARIMEQAFYDLDAPVARVCTMEVPVPYAKHLEEAALPSPERILAAARTLLSPGASG